MTPPPAGPTDPDDDAPAAEPTKPTAPTKPAKPTAPTAALTVNARTHRTIVTLLIIIAVLLAVIAGFLLRNMSAGNDGSPQAGTTPSANAADQGAHPAGPNPEETAAPSQTDPQTLELIRAQARRDPADKRARGNVNAPVVMVIYSDFACPFCTQFAQEVGPELDDLVANGTLRIEWRDLAQITQSSPLAAQAGIAAANQGKFWEFHDAVYAAADPQGHPEYTEESLVAFARQAGVADLEKFRTDMTAAETVQAVSQAAQEAYQIGIRGTPFLLVGDAYISGYRPASYVRATVLEQAAAH